jgi:hypothetical protein
VRRLALLSLVLVVALLGCSEGAEEVPSREDSSPSTDTEEDADPGSNDELLIFTRSGGFAGTTETLTVLADGRAEIEGDASPPGRIEVPPELLTRLEEELESLDWESAATEPQNVVCADCFAYDIRAGGQRIKTTGLGQSGKELGDLLALVDEIITTGSRG